MARNQKVSSVPDTAVMEVLANIASGHVDGRIREVFDAVRARLLYLKHERALNNAATLKHGDHAVIGHISPSYLTGQVVVIQSIRNTRAAIKWADPDAVRVLSRGRFGSQWDTGTSIPLSALTKVDRKKVS